jgi:hypothetical protein
MNARTIEMPRFEERPLVRGSRAAQLAREVLWCAAVLAVWVGLFLYASATVPETWAPDPETRAAIVEAQARAAPTSRAAAAAR